LLEQLSLEGRGSAEFVRPDESVERMVGVVANRLVDPVLTDVRVRVEGDVRLSRMLPMQPSDLFADRDLVVLARYSGHGSGRITVEGNRRGASVRWTSTVDFPDRERQNPFVARLWAAQRVGFLSAEKRKNGGTSEVDEEIRTLGERYGIPTEFTSYLVVEPRMVVANRRALDATAMVPDARQAQQAQTRDARTQRFEEAKAASVQRAAQSLVALDSLRGGVSVATGEMAATVRRVDSRTFVLRDSTWTDQRYRSGMSLTKIKPFTKAYFDLVSALPELRAPFALGNRVIVVGRDRAISLSDDGAETLSSTALASLVKSW
jgi:Ca-activated chloride channel family protein